MKGEVSGGGEGWRGGGGVGVDGGKDVIINSSINPLFSIHLSTMDAIISLQLPANREPLILYSAFTCPPCYYFPPVTRQ